MFQFDHFYHDIKSEDVYISKININIQMSTFPYGAMNGGSSSAYSAYDPSGASQLMGAANYLGLSNYLGAYNSATSNSTASSTTGVNTNQVTPTDAASRLALGWHNDNNWPILLTADHFC